MTIRYSVNHKSINELVIEVFKIQNAFAAEIVEHVKSNENYFNLQKRSDMTHLPQHLCAISRRQLLLPQAPSKLVLSLFNLENLED